MTWTTGGNVQTEGLETLLDDKVYLNRLEFHVLTDSQLQSFHIVSHFMPK